MPRIWLITGCSSGLGRELAIAAAANKDTVIATSRDPSKLSDLKDLGIVPLKLDVNAPDEEVQAIIDETVSKIGPIDILVNNAGYILEGAVEEASSSEIESLFSTNLFSQLRLLRSILPSMRARRTGTIANLGSIGGWGGAPACGLYCSTKAAIAIYSEALRAEVAPFNIKVTCIEPGYFRTNFLTGGHKVTVKRRIPELDGGVTGAGMDALREYSLKQPGDPVKGARVLVEALTGSGRCGGLELPGRLALGSDALKVIGEIIDRERAVLDTWGGIVGGTDCDDV